LIHSFTFAHIAELFSRQLFDFRGIVFQAIDVYPKPVGRPLQLLQIKVQLLGIEM
jgi:hypothetical protein